MKKCKKTVKMILYVLLGAVLIFLTYKSFAIRDNKNRFTSVEEKISYLFDMYDFNNVKYNDNRIDWQCVEISQRLYDMNEYSLGAYGDHVYRFSQIGMNNPSISVRIVYGKNKKRAVAYVSDDAVNSYDAESYEKRRKIDDIIEFISEDYYRNYYRKRIIRLNKNQIEELNVIIDDIFDGYILCVDDAVGDDGVAYFFEKHTEEDDNALVRYSFTAAKKYEIAFDQILSVLDIDK